MESVKLLENLFDKQVLTILRMFLDKKEQTFYLQEVAKQCRVPIATTFRIVNKLVTLELIKITHFKHWKTYSLQENDQTKFLEQMLEQKHTIIDEFVELIGALPEVARVMEIHGSDPKERKYKISVIIIGDVSPDVGKVKEIIGKIKEKYNFTIIPITLSFEQFDQQAAIGLYAGKKLSALFEREPL